MSLFSRGFAVYFVDLESGMLIGGEEAGMFIYTDPSAAFKVGSIVG